jgi:hypothetical protein
MHQVGPVFSHGAFLLSQQPNTEENIVSFEPPVLPQHAFQAATLVGMSHPCSYCGAEPNQPCTYVNEGKRQGRIKPTAHAPRLVLGKATYQAWLEAMKQYHADARNEREEFSLRMRANVHFELSPEQEAWIAEQSKASIERYEARKAAGARPTQSV